MTLPNRIRGALGGILAPLMVAMSSACGDVGARTRASVVGERDSAGVRIVELNDVYRHVLPEWTLVGPTVVIGEDPELPGQDLFNVAGVTVLGHGRVVVANAGTEELRVYDRSGRFLQSIGRKGEGPGEFGEAARQVARDAPARQTPPAFEGLAVDSEHSLWVKRPRRRPDDPSEWVVLTASGSPAARVEMPRDLLVFEIGADYVIGVRRNELDVEQVVMYELNGSRGR